MHRKASNRYYVILVVVLVSGLFQYYIKELWVMNNFLNGPCKIPQFKITLLPLQLKVFNSYPYIL